MSRLAELRSRREVLLARCAEQRTEFARRVARLRPGSTRAAQAGTEGTGPGGVRHTIAWIALLWGAMLVGRAREVVSLLLFVRSALGLVAQAGQLLRGFTARRSPRPARAAAAEVVGPAEHG